MFYLELSGKGEVIAIMNINTIYMKKQHLALKEVDNNIIVFEPMTKTYEILNQIAKDILVNCDGNNDIDSIVNLIYEMYDNKDKEEVQRDVLECIEALENAGLVEKKNEG